MVSGIEKRRNVFGMPPEAGGQVQISSVFANGKIL